MSYMRSPYSLDNFNKKSKMYVYECDTGISSSDYQNEDMIEMLIEQWSTNDNLFKNWWIKKMCERLKIDLKSQEKEQ